MDTFDVIATERVRLADELDQLHPPEWDAPSLCAGWTNHVVVAHLNVPWSIGRTTLLAGLLRARGNIAKTIDRASLDLAAELDPAACVARYREHATDRFTPPTLGAEAPLTDCVLHGADILQPLGRSVDVSPEALRTILAFLVSPAAKRAFRSVGIDGLAFQATDLDETFGSGAQLVRGPALALAAAMLGRRPFFEELEGDGVAVLADRL
ncbi:MAG: hypothetical protein JWM89_3790 [Acidimicrobiales bacterium]|nr:hypothetical protein [Acidimicrobiales bacterium]